jgi:hypothetical protein
MLAQKRPVDSCFKDVTAIHCGQHHIPFLQLVGVERCPSPITHQQLLQILLNPGAKNGFFRLEKSYDSIRNDRHIIARML